MHIIRFSAGNYIVPQYAQRQEVQFNYGPDSTLGGPARRVATPIVEDDTEPPVYFPPSSQAVQLDRKAKVVPQPKQSYPVYQALNQGDFRYSYNYYWSYWSLI